MIKLAYYYKIYYFIITVYILLYLNASLVALFWIEA